MSEPRDINDIAPAYARHIFKFGRATLTPTRSVIWDGGDGYNGFLTENKKVQVVSDDNVADKPAGTGALTMRIWGQNLAGEQLTEDFILNGTTPVESTKEYCLIYIALILTAGNVDPITGPNVGTIKVYETGQILNVMAQIQPKEGRTLMCIYRIPAGFFGKFRVARGFPAAGKDVTIGIYTRNGLTQGTAWNIAGSIDIPAGGAPAIIDLDLERLLPEGTDIIIMGAVDSVTGVASANFEILLEEL